MYFWLLILFITFLSSFVAAVSGLGLATILISVLVFLLPYDQVMIYSALVHGLHDCWRLFYFWHAIDIKIFSIFGGAAIIGTIIGSFFVVEQPLFMHFLLGIVLLSYALIMIVQPRIEIPAKLRYLIGGGFLSGLSAGMFGVRGVLKGAILISYGLSPMVYLGTMAAISFAIDSVRIFAYLLQGITLPTSLWVAVVCAVPLTWLGVWLGALFVGKVSQRTFRIIVATCIALLALQLIISWLV